MKKFVPLLFLTAIMLGVFSLFVSQSSFAAKPEKAQVPHQKTTGEFLAYVGSQTIEMKVSAHNTDPAKGHVYYSYSGGRSFEGVVTDYLQVGDKSVFVGDITDSSGFPTAQKHFKVWTYDAGEGEMADPDKFRVVLYTDPQSCGSVITGYGATVAEGNIQVHQK